MISRWSFLVLACMVIIGVFSFSGCGAPATPQYQLTFVTQGSGTLTTDPNTGPYDEGTQVNLTATPSAGCVFDHWEGGLTGTANPIVVTMDVDKTVTAVFTAATPIIAPNGGDFTSSTSVTLTTATDGAAVYYTTDATVPSAAATLYTGPITLTATTTIKALAVKAGLPNSPVATAAFTGHVADPTFTPAANEVLDFADITISSTDGASIYYTIDGSTPTTTSAIYTAPIHRVLSTSIKALAVKAGLSDSAVVIKLITVFPTFNMVSVSTAGVQGNGASAFPNISADGRYIAFLSEATNLVEGDTNGHADVFLYDRQSGKTIRASVKSDGTQGNGDIPESFPSLSADGRYVAFTSDATNLVDGDTNAKADIFVFDRQTGRTVRVNVKSDGTQANNITMGFSLSANGRYVVFASAASNLIDGDTNGKADVFIHDCQTGQTTRISLKTDGTQTNGDSMQPAISADGQYVAFVSNATNLIDGDTNAKTDIFLHNCQTGQTTRISTKSDGTQANDNSMLPSICAAGRYVAFLSTATNLVDADTNGKQDVFVHDCQSGQTTRVSVKTDGTQANSDCYFPFISADGNYVTFSSPAATLVDGDTNGVLDIFIHSMITGQTLLVSRKADGTQSNGIGNISAVSGDGRYVVFDSEANNLSTGDTNAKSDVFLRDYGPR
jgi:Tol biopolymer transport system component